MVAWDRSLRLTGAGLAGSPRVMQRARRALSQKAWAFVEVCIGNPSFGPSWQQQRFCTSRVAMEAATSNRKSLLAWRAPAVGRACQRAWDWVAQGRWAIHALYLGTAFLITSLYWQSTEQLATATLDKFVGGVANKPFAYRVLMPYIIGVTAELNGFGNMQMADVPLRILTLFGTMLLLQRWLRHFVHRLLADVMPLLLGVILPWSFLFYWPYDFSGILLWTACLLCLVERQYYLYLLLFILGVLNRETAGFLMFIFATTQWQSLGQARTLRWVGAQLAIWLAIFIGLRLFIHPRDGEAVEIHVLNNLLYLVRGYGLGPLEHWLRLLSGLGFLWVLAPWYWSKKSPFLRRACWVLPGFFLAMLVVARFVETRVWYEWIPIAMALSGQSLMEFARQGDNHGLVGGAARP